jgi:ABC-type cobalamin/Fe3+-siderophores transport system ATPase subunit
MDESDTAAEANADQQPDAAADSPGVPPLIKATGLGLDGEHGPLYSGVNLELTPGFHAIRMPGGPSQHTLLLTLAGRLKPTRGEVTVNGDHTARAIRRHCAIAAFADIDQLEEMVTVQTVLTEQRRWVSPWLSWVPNQTSAAEFETVFGDIPAPAPGTYIIELSDLELFLLRISLALMSDRPILVVGDLEQVRDNTRRAMAVERLGAIAEDRTVVVGVTNPLGVDASEHELHDHLVPVGKD